MAILKKDNITPPTVRKETVTVPEIGGDVVIRGLLLQERTDMMIASANQGYYVSDLLAATVIDADDQPIWTREEWELFGADHYLVSINLFKKAKALSGLDADASAEKS